MKPAPTPELSLGERLGKMARSVGMFARHVAVPFGTWHNPEAKAPQDAVISEAFFRTKAVFPGFVWIAGAAVYLLCWPAIALARLPNAVPAAEPSEAP
jgi:hypothetical protein